MEAMAVPEVDRWRAPTPLPRAVRGGRPVVMAARQSNAHLRLDERLCVVRSGRLVARLESEPGTTVVEVLFPGDVVTEGVFGGEAPRTLTALTPASLLVLDAPEALRMLAAGGGATRWLLDGMTQRVRRAENRQANLMTADARTRLSRFLLDWCETTADVHLPSPFRGGVAQSVLAELVGSTRHTVNRILRDFQKRGVVVLEHGGVTIDDFDVLKRCARDARPYFRGRVSPAVAVRQLDQGPDGGANTLRLLHRAAARAM